MSHNFRRRLVAISSSLLLAGCAAAPAERYDRLARSAALNANVVDGIGFAHRVYTAPGRSDTHLHVYLEGDGTPFLTPRTIARDPTPRRAVALDLLHRDPAPAVLVGRPCYHGLTAGCTPVLWTTARYSETVIASMARAIERVMERGNYRTATLIGYSGGGAIAVLLAERLAAVDAVVTIAANLDIATWTDLHGYSALTGSLNPVDVIGTRSGLRHLHLTGSADANVPPHLHDALRPRLPANALQTVDGFDHRCCWVSIWPNPLDRVAR